MSNNWEEKYWELMLKENFDEAIPLKLDNFPKSFFKYRTLSNRTIENLNESYVWLAEISSLNDPFECSIQFDNDECLRLFYGSNKFRENFKIVSGETLSQKEIFRLTESQKPYEEYLTLFKEKGFEIKVTPEEQLKKVQSRWDEIVKERNQNLKICSFSLVKHSLLLWSHYSQDHKGIAIEYDFINSESIRAFIQPIIYRNRIHKIGLFEEYNTINMIVSGLIKSEEWSYEKEWRITSFKQFDEFPNIMKVPKPVAIYLGTRFSENDEKLKSELYAYAKKNKVPLNEMVKHPNKFELIAK
mgnify:CR=1 FL=1|tara:strand:- start:808 stop:1707 length:900 start_codon:yes stop_codon:yes gene_type:complete